MSSNYQYIKRLLLGRFSVLRTLAILFTQLLGVSLVSVSFYFAFDIESFFEASSGDENYVVLTQEVSTLSDFMGLDQSILPSTIEKLEAMEGVKGVGQFLSSSFKVVGSLSVGSGVRGGGVSTEMFFEAVDSSFIDVVDYSWGFDPSVDDFVPVIIPQNYVNLYNFGFSNSMGLPKLSKDVIGEVEFELLLYRSGYGGMVQPKELRGKVVGFSNRINTILAPIEFVRWANREYGRGEEAEKVSRLIVEIDPLLTAKVLDEAKEMGLESEGTVSSFDEVGGVISVVVLVVVLVGVMITLLSVALMVMMLYVLVERNRAKIENLRMLGFSSRDVFRPFGNALLRFMLFGVLLGWGLSVVVRFVYVWVIESYVVSGSEVELEWLLPSLIQILLWGVLYFGTREVVRRRVSS